MQPKREISKDEVRTMLYNLPPNTVIRSKKRPNSEKAKGEANKNEGGAIDLSKLAAKSQAS